MSVRYMTEEEHVLRMARAMYECHHRREGALIMGWSWMPEERRLAYLDLARRIVDEVDAIHGKN